VIRSCLTGLNKPGETNNVPDIALALTIKSERGHREFGTLPLN